MSGKRNISYVKPQDPSFLAKLKAEIGYREGPTVESKRPKLEHDDSGSDSEGRPGREEEKPQIVVLQSGDLTAEEVLKEEQRIAKEASEARADLSKPIVFQKRKEIEDSSAACKSSTSKSKKSNSSSHSLKTNTKGNEALSKEVNKHNSKSNKYKKTTEKSKLSFNLEEEDDVNV